MAYVKPQDLDAFVPLLTKSDTKFRLQLGTDLLNFLQNDNNVIQTQDIGLLIDHILHWTQSSNFKVCVLGIEILIVVIDKLGQDFRPYLIVVLTVIIDRLGDSKEAVRDKSKLLLLKLIEKSVISSQNLLEKLQPAFSHKNSRIREEVLRSVVIILNTYGCESLSLNKFTISITRLLSDSTVTVRDEAFQTLVELYRHVGDRLKNDIERKGLVPASKLHALLSKFEEIKNSGALLPSALVDNNTMVRKVDEVDRIANYKEPVSAMAFVKATNTIKKPTDGTTATATIKKAPLPNQINNTNSSSMNSINSGSTSSAVSLMRSHSVRKPTSTITCAVDEDAFRKAFEDVPAVQIYSSKDLQDLMSAIKDTISDQNKDWSKRVESLKKIRSVLMSGMHEYEEFGTMLRTLEYPLQAILKDLRSQVVREACITIAYLSNVLKSRADHFNELFLPVLINLIQNSAKVMATAGIVTVRFIISNSQCARLIPLILQHVVNSRSKEIRRACCDFLEFILSTWSTQNLEKHIVLIQQALKHGISDADPEARTFSRRAFKSFKEHFPDQAELLLLSLDTNYRRALQGELSLSSSSSCSSLAQRTLKTLSKPPVQPSHIFSDTESGSMFELQSDNRLRSGSLSKISAIPVLMRTESFLVKNHVTNKIRTPIRSNSAIDAQAAKRANVRKQYATLARNKIASGTATIPRPQKIMDLSFEKASSTPSPQERYGRTKYRNRSSQSTPSSRENSPSIKLSLSNNYIRLNESIEMQRNRRMSSGIPRSTTTSRNTSRETSPSRRYYTKNDRPPASPFSRPLLAEKLLMQSQEAEVALAGDPLKCDTDFSRFVLKKSQRSFDNHSDESETSSICSERSIDSCRRFSDSISWNGSQNRLRELWDTNRSITEIVENIRSINWKERKEGLIALQYFMTKGNLIPLKELRIIMDIFVQMFYDSHTKVLTVFLDTLIMVISHHKNYLNEWLFILFQRTFSKLGGDLLNSTNLKLHKTLDAIKMSFDPEMQLGAIFRFVMDNTQTPNLKTKIAIMNYLAQLCSSLDETYFSDNLPVRYALDKIFPYTEDAKSMELRNAAKAVILSLHNCNPLKMSHILKEFPPKSRENYLRIIESAQKRQLNGMSCFSPTPSSLSPSSPTNSNLIIPLHLHNNSHTSSSTNNNNNNNSLNSNNNNCSLGIKNVNQIRNSSSSNHLNSDEVMKSLQKTSTEIQNYSFDTIEKNSTAATSSSPGSGTGTCLQQSQPTSFNGSSNHQMNNRIENGNCNADDTNDEFLKLEKQMYQLSLESENVSSTNNKLIFNNITNSNGSSNDCITSLDVTDCETIINEFIKGEIIKSSNANRENVFSTIIQIIKKNNVDYIKQRFSDMIATLLHMISSGDQNVQIGTLDILTEVFECDTLKPLCADILDLLIMKILSLHTQENKEVVKHAEIASFTLATFPFKKVSKILKPLIETYPYPMNQVAVKMLMKAVENHPNDISDEHLCRLMPGLIKAFNHEQSPMRKSAVFCIVALHKAVGEDRLSPHLKTLGSCKLKLLNVYISRAQANNSSSTLSSPKTLSNSQ